MRRRLFICFMRSISPCFAQESIKLGRAVVNQNWEKVFKLISKEIDGTKIPSDQYNAVFDSLISHFKAYDFIADAEWSRCGAKILIYPGQETIVLKFKTRNAEVEKSFLINTAKYQTMRRFLGLRIRIPTIDRKELVTVLMRDSEKQSMIKVMREICIWEMEEAKKRIHNAKVFFRARVIGGKQERAFPPLNFNCQNKAIAIEFSATNQTDDSLRIYWPSFKQNSDPLFRVNFKSYSSELDVYEDTSVYENFFEVITLQGKETIKTTQYLSKNDAKLRLPKAGAIHYYHQLQLDDFQKFSSEKGIARIGFSSNDNGLTWMEDDIWKPAEPLYIFHLASYTITNTCE
jgi:hypothetical protein